MMVEPHTDTNCGVYDVAPRALTLIVGYTVVHPDTDAHWLVNDGGTAH